MDTKKSTPADGFDEAKREDWMPSSRSEPRPFAPESGSNDSPPPRRPEPSQTSDGKSVSDKAQSSGFNRAHAGNTREAGKGKSDRKPIEGGLTAAKSATGDSGKGKSDRKPSEGGPAAIKDRYSSLK